MQVNKELKQYLAEEAHRIEMEMGEQESGKLRRFIEECRNIGGEYIVIEADMVSNIDRYYCYRQPQLCEKVNDNNPELSDNIKKLIIDIDKVLKQGSSKGRLFPGRPDWYRMCYFRHNLDRLEPVNSIRCDVNSNRDGMITDLVKVLGTMHFEYMRSFDKLGLKAVEIDENKTEKRVKLFFSSLRFELLAGIVSDLTFGANKAIMDRMSYIQHLSREYYGKAFNLSGVELIYDIETGQQDYGVVLSRDAVWCT